MCLYFQLTAAGGELWKRRGVLCVREFRSSSGTENKRSYRCGKLLFSSVRSARALRDTVWQHLYSGQGYIPAMMPSHMVGTSLARAFT